ncbi:MAG: transglycosylase domain-containing protein [Pseudolabrys sp.]|nr:transglycosylase domain-containing protein [Pseudolabrys sp.]
MFERRYGGLTARRAVRVPFLPLWLRAALGVLLVLLLIPYLLAPLYRVVDPASTLMLWRSLTGQRVVQTWVPLEAVAPVLPLTVIMSEDGRFCWHHGVDFRELRAALADAEDLDDMRGGSTITQQVAKNLFLWPGRSVVRKALEFPLALWIDLTLPKRRIIEIYLNIAEWGPDGEFGIEAGAQRAFGRPARGLTAYQAALMAAMLPNPVERDARSPGPGLRRLAGLYVRRASRGGSHDDCLAARRQNP